MDATVEGAGGRAETIVRGLFEEVGVRVDGKAPHDPQVHDSRFYARVLGEGSLGLGEAYVEGWWDADSVDGFIYRLLRGRIEKQARQSPRAAAQALWLRLANRQRKHLAARDVRAHYERGLDLFRAMLDPRMTYSCAYWRAAETLEEAQEAKLELVCRKLGLEEGMHLLDIGCGWGSLVKYAAERFGVRATGITLSPEQAEAARESCRGLPVDVRVEDYRNVRGTYEAVVSVGMFEHVGSKNYRSYMEAVDRCLAPGGISLLHTIAGNERTAHADRWIHRYVFPGANLPTLSQAGEAAEGLFVVEDVHNFGPDYDRTLRAWLERFEEAWPDLRSRYGDDFRRVWRYYLLSTAAAFRARYTQLFQVVLTRPGTERGHPEALEPFVARWDDRST